MCVFWLFVPAGLRQEHYALPDSILPPSSIQRLGAFSMQRHTASPTYSFRSQNFHVANNFGVLRQIRYTPTTVPLLYHQAWLKLSRFSLQDTYNTVALSLSNSPGDKLACENTHSSYPQAVNTQPIQTPHFVKTTSYFYGTGRKHIPGLCHYSGYSYFRFVVLHHTLGLA